MVRAGEAEQGQVSVECLGACRPRQSDAIRDEFVGATQHGERPFEFGAGDSIRGGGPKLGGALDGRAVES